MDNLQLSKEFLEKVLNSNSRALVGRVMKRFEILSHSGDIKKSIKELIYESYRITKSQLESFSYGVEFKSPPKGKEDNNGQN
ncbi:hypothetical protein LCGC14_1718910 [marine sediment metagenome]|uniref:Uncharacterized protein n=1 Tax=marine sediment metagenome TaxID=412755 RepID=A0A0F9JTH8_9ZZZZ